jgi:predicted nucleic acid-binding protein
MGVQYAVEADVFDIGHTMPQRSDRFLVDSNVWLWMTYTNAGHGAPDWRTDVMARYASFVQAAVDTDAKVWCCALSLAELSHTIEKTEREIYSASTGTSIKAKEYRHHLTSERARVVTEIKAAWAQVTSLAEPLTATIDSPMVSSALGRLQAVRVDGYDLFILESMRKHGVVQVITDDGDFASVQGIKMFTMNRTVISAARAQGQLRYR